MSRCKPRLPSANRSEPEPQAALGYSPEMALLQCAIAAPRLPLQPHLRRDVTHAAPRRVASA